MTRTIDYLYKAHDNISPAFARMTNAEKRFETNTLRGFARIKAGMRGMSAGTGKWLKREINLRNELNSKAARYVGGAAIAAGIYKSVQAHADLEKELYKLQQRTGASDSEIQQYKKHFQELSYETGQSASGLVAAGAEFAGAGDTISASFEKVRISARGAVTGFTDVQTVASGVQAVMAGFKIPITETEMTMARMITAADAGTIELENLSQVMGDLTSPALRANASLVEVLAGMEALSVSGVPNAAHASTAFARLLESLVSSDVQKKFTKQAKKIGSENLRQIHEVYSSLGSEAEKNKFLESVWGKGAIRQMRALVPLIKNMDKYEDILKEIEGATPEDALKKFIKQSQRADVQLAKIRAQFQAIGADTGVIFMPAIKLLGNMISQLRKIQQSGEAPDEGGGVVGAAARNAERYAYTQQAAGGGLKGTIAAEYIGLLDQTVGRLAGKSFSYEYRKKKGYLTPSEQRQVDARNKQMAPGEIGRWRQKEAKENARKTQDTMRNFPSYLQPGGYPFADQKLKAEVDPGPIAAATAGAVAKVRINPIIEINPTFIVDGKKIPIKKKDTGGDG